MRNSLLLVALFLGGMTTQTVTAQHQNDAVINKGNKHRYYNSQSIRFVENGVLFQVFTDGTFTFSEAYNGQPYIYGRTNHNVNYYNGNGRRGNNRRYGNRPLRVKRDRFGTIVGVNGICIGYKRNGKVNQIGSVPIYHQRGNLVQVGGMTIEYNRFGSIRKTYGHINRQNRKVWHDDWITYNNYDNNWNEHEVWNNRINRKRSK